MKQIILTTALFLALAGTVSAQTTKTVTAKKTSTSSSKQKKEKATKSKKNKIVNRSRQKANDTANQRRIYHYANGQRSTPTGRDATPSNGGYAALKADTSSKPKPKKH
ncbi:MAG: hypothetical protein M3Y85_02605 [Bacteroidota bacterium]|nr:hypothetical protein [Bacteroidota bacterium]